MNVDLLDCPFCGRAPDTENTPASGTTIYCAHEDCGGARIFVGVDETDRHGEEAVFRWNRRALPSTAGEPVFATIVDLERQVGIPEDALHTLMAHGMLRKLDGQLYRLAGGCELEADPGSAGVNVHTPGAILAVLRAVLSAVAAPPPAAANPSVAYMRVHSDGVRRVATLSNSLDTWQVSEGGWSVVPLYASPSDASNLIPKLDNCGRYLAEDNTGQWHYLNHANEWQTYAGPTTSRDEVIEEVADFVENYPRSVRDLGNGTATVLPPKQSEIAAAIRSLKEGEAK